MAVSLPQYQNPEDIKIYGEMVNAFSTAAKALAALKQTIRALRSTLAQTVGEGRYNSQAAEQDYYIIYGPQKTEAARHNNTGLFGGFFYIHLPELLMALYGPRQLGKAGCQLRAKIRGTVIHIPLHKLELWFTPNPRGENAPADIFITKDYGALRAGTVIMQGRHWIKREEMHLDIVDASGKSLDAKAVALMLWCHLAAVGGFKKHGRDSARYQTLAARQVNGVDDDFAAEGFMIEWLESVKKRNGIDLMPAFNDYVYKSHLTLCENSEFLEAMSHGFAIAHALRQSLEAHPVIKSGASYDKCEGAYNDLMLQTAQVGAGLTAAVQILGLPLDTISIADYAAPIADTIVNLTEKVNNIRIKNITESYRHNVLQNVVPFSSCWVDGSGDVSRSFYNLANDSRVISQFWPDVWEEIQIKLHSTMLQNAQTNLSSFGTRFTGLIHHSQLLGGSKDGIEACYHAKRALRMISEKLMREQGIGSLRAEVEMIRTAYDALKSGCLPTEDNVCKITAQKRHITSRQIQKVAKQARTLERNANTLIEGLKQFLDFMDAINCDGDKWIALYGNCPALEPQGRASEPVPDLRSVLAANQTLAKPALVQGAAV